MPTVKNDEPDIIVSTRPKIEDLQLIVKRLEEEIRQLKLELLDLYRRLDNLR